MNVIDNIIESHTEFNPYDFTGGNIQISVSKHNKVLTVSLILYFGFNATRNTISRKFEIEPSEINRFSLDLLKRAEIYVNSLQQNECKKLSYECLTKQNECRTNVVRDVSSGSGSGNLVVGSDIVGSSGSDSSRVATPHGVTKDTELQNEFDIIYREQKIAMKKSLTASGNPRKNSQSKDDHFEKYKKHRKTFNFETMVCIVRNDIIGKPPKDMANLLGKDFPKKLAQRLKKQNNELLEEVSVSNDKDFIQFIDAIEDK